MTYLPNTGSPTIFYAAMAVVGGAVALAIAGTKQLRDVVRRKA